MRLLGASARCAVLTRCRARARSFLARVQVVVCSCAGAGLLHEGQLSRSEMFDVVMVDEAGQALLPEALIPLTLAKPLGRSLLCGARLGWGAGGEGGRRRGSILRAAALLCGARCGRRGGGAPAAFGAARCCAVRAGKEEEEEGGADSTRVRQGAPQGPHGAPGVLAAVWGLLSAVVRNAHLHLRRARSGGGGAPQVTRSSWAP